MFGGCLVHFFRSEQPEASAFLQGFQMDFMFGDPWISWDSPPPRSIAKEQPSDPQAGAPRDTCYEGPTWIP